MWHPKTHVCFVDHPAHFFRTQLLSLPGFGVRPFALLGMVFAAQLYLGLHTHPGEWPWEFIFIIVICWMFNLYAAGRSLGLEFAFVARDHGREGRRPNRAPLSLGFSASG